MMWLFGVKVFAFVMFIVTTILRAKGITHPPPEDAAPELLHKALHPVHAARRPGSDGVDLRAAPRSR